MNSTFIHADDKTYRKQQTHPLQMGVANRRLQSETGHSDLVIT